MLFGEGTSEDEAHRLLDGAAAGGINFFDSAEMYSIPQRAETQGLSETILGNWLRRHQRSDYVIATKVAGPGGMEWLRGGPTKLDARNITAAIDGSLQRLQTDYIDLLQLHWPDRYVPMFGDIEYDTDMSYSAVPFDEQLEAVGTAITAGKVRYFGLSNETPYGLMKFCSTADTNSSSFSTSSMSSTFPYKERQLPRPVSLQNAYSLTCRTFDSGLAECCHQEHISLLAYSPLAMGLLSGKYLAPDGGPPEARLNKYKGRYGEAESRYGPKPNVKEAVAAYVELAAHARCSPVSLAIRFVLSHPLVASAIVGATSVEQLEEVLEAAREGELDAGLRERIDAIHARYPSPTP